MNLHGEGKKNRLRFLFGPGTIFMLLVLGIVVSKQVMTPRHVSIERKVIGSGKKLESQKPTVTDLLQWCNELKFKPEQIQELKNVEQTELTALRPVEQDIEDVQREFDKLVVERQGQGVAMSEIQRLSEPASRLGFIKRKMIEAASDRALTVLEPEQRSRAMEMAQSQLSLVRRSAANK